MKSQKKSPKAAAKPTALAKKKSAPAPKKAAPLMTKAMTKKSKPAPAPAPQKPVAPAPQKAAAPDAAMAKPGRAKGGRRAALANATGYAAQALAYSSESRTKSQLCRVIGCTQPATTLGYSRLCYIKYWKQIKQKDEILAHGTLQRFIKELVDKYPEKVIMAIRTDLASNDAYAQMIRDLDLYGGIDELEHVAPTAADEEEAQENDLEDIKKGMDKEDDLF